MKEKYEGIEYKIFKYTDHENIEKAIPISGYYFEIYVYDDWNCCDRVYHEGDEVYDTLDECREAAIEYIERKMQNG